MVRETEIKGKVEEEKGKNGGGEMRTDTKESRRETKIKKKRWKLVKSQGRRDRRGMSVQVRYNLLADDQSSVLI